jgi:hypothetical protein
MGRLESKVAQLDTLHKRHLARPSFDDVAAEEAEIKAVTKEISEVSLKKQTGCKAHNGCFQTF